MADDKPRLYELMTRAEDRRERIRQHAMDGIRNVIPSLSTDDYELDVEDFDYKPTVFSPSEQKLALMEGRTLVEPLKGTVTLKDKKSGKILDRSKRTLVHLPYFTERHTFVMGGNDYTVANQVRIKPGVYTRQRENGQLEASFNLSKGRNFRLEMDPERGVFFMQYGTTRIPLYAVLSALGVSDSKMTRMWNADVTKINKSYSSGKENKHIRKLYEKVIPSFARKTGLSHEERIEAIKESYKTTSMDANVTQMTLGQKFDTVQPKALLRASQKLLNVYNDKEEQDDRDSTAFKTLHTVESFFKERIEKDAARDVRSKVRRKMNRSKTKDALKVSDVLPNAPFSKSVHNFLTTSALSATPMQINPMEIIDQSVKVTSLGEGGISSTLAVPDEARDVHYSHFGMIDPVRTPESGKAGIDVRTALHTARDDDGNMYAPLKNRRTGQVEYKRADELEDKTIAFPNQKLTGSKYVDAMRRGKVVSVKPTEVDYSIPTSASMYSPTTNLVPFLESAQGNRNIMGSKMQTQALPLKEREEPYVQVRSWAGDDRTVEQEFGEMTVPISPVDGTIDKIDGDFVYIRPDRMKSASEVTYSVFDDHGSDDDEELMRRYDAHIDGKNVAYASLKPTSTEGDGPWISGVWVNPDNRGQGLARELMARITEDHRGEVLRLRARPYKDKAVDKETLMKIYEGMGFSSYDPDKPGRMMKQAADDAELHKVPYAQMFPLMSKTYLNDELKVKKGDRVKKNQVLADSNFTRNGKLALGKNMSVGYMPYNGLNSNDAVVISEGAALKMTSMHMYKEKIDIDPSTVLDRDKHKAYFGSRYSKAEYNRLDSKGVIKKGQRINNGEIVIAAMKSSQASSKQQMLGRLHKSLVKPYRDAAVTWDHHNPGTVEDVAITSSQVLVTIRTDEPMRVGDKLANRYGAKGVVSKIVPDDQMVRDEKEKPLDILMTSAGIITRINPNQILETAVGKVAEKTGKPVVIDQFADHDNVQWAKDLMKQHGVKDKETVYDPLSDKKIPNIHVGRQYVYKLFKSTDTNYAARGIGPGYDANMQPTKGGDEGAKSIGKMEFNALIAHNARNILSDVTSIKGQKNDEYWRRLQLGLPAPTPSTNFAYDKFTKTLHGAGIKVNKDGNKRTLAPLTDRDIDDMAERTINNALLVKPKKIDGVPTIAPEKGGLFDPAATGGLDGDKYSKIDLAEPVVNPVFVEPARRLLGMTKSEFQDFRDDKGAAEVKRMLNNLDLNKLEKDLQEQVRSRSGSARNTAVKKLKYIRALSKEQMRPGDAYVLTKLPVTPPKVRPITPNPDGTTLVSDANYLYRDVMLANESIKETPEELRYPDEMKLQRRHLHDTVGALFGTNDPVSPQNKGRGVKGHLRQITGTGSPKGGFFHSRMLKKRQDLSGRATIAPDHTLGLDELGVPEQMGWRMYEPFIVKRLIKNGYSATEARQLYKDQAPAAKRELDIEIQDRPVLFNRAPSLHRFNMVAAYPKLVPGKTIRLNPFAESGMNADYDGDTVQLHTPVSDAAKNEAKSITLSNLLFGDRSKDDLMVFPAHEALIGAYMATKDSATGKTKTFATKADALAAYKRGEIKMNSRVKIKGKS